MKKGVLFCCSFILLVVASCSSHNDGDNGYILPPAGTTIQADSMKVTDELNHFAFAVAIKADSNIKYGVYDVLAVWGPDTANGQFTMPRGAEKLKPILKKGAAPSTYTIGFYYGNDTTFYDYYRVTGAKGRIEMEYLKAYSFK